MAVNKPRCLSNTAECLFLPSLPKILDNAKQRYQGGTVVVLEARGGIGNTQYKLANSNMSHLKRVI